MNHLADITEIRRSNLQKWIDAKFKGKQAGFVALTDINQGELSALLRNKSFGEKKARNIEEKAGMPKMWLDSPDAKIPPIQFKRFQPIKQQEQQTENTNKVEEDEQIRFELLNVQASMGNGIFHNEEVEVLDYVNVSMKWAKKHLGNNLNHIRVITAKGDSMKGTIDSGDVLFVDESINYFNGEGIYVIAYADGIKAKRLQMQINGSLKIISDNVKYPAEIINADELDAIQICGKVKGAWNLSVF